MTLTRSKGRSVSRRSFLRAATGLLWTPLGSAQSQPPQAGGDTFVYVGTYTPNGGGIYLFRMDESNGALSLLQVFDDVRNPTWLVIDASQSHLYAISEIDNYLGGRTGAVVSYAIDAGTRHLRKIGTVSSGGATPSHLSLHPAGKFAFVANYGGGNVAVMPVGSDGSLGEVTDLRPSVGARHHARGSDAPEGQFAMSDHDSPHVHMVSADPSGSFVIANDAGLDLTLVWRFDAQAGRLLPAPLPVIEAPAGSAPRHFLFHPNGRAFYNLYEHAAKVAVYDFDPSHGALKLKQSISTLPPRFAGSALASELVMTADGRFLYVANRLHSSVGVFAVEGDGQLRMLADTWVRADSPRSLALDPRGEFLYSCNQRGDSITSFRVGAAGALNFTGRFEPVGSPAAMAFLHRS